MLTHKRVTRRTLLKTAAATVAVPYIVPSSVFGAGTQVAPSNRIVMGCIGTGGKGTGDMVAFLQKPQVQMVAVCDVDTKLRNRARDKVNEKYGNKDCAVYNDFRQIIARDDIDAVSIGTPDHWHAIPAIMAARAGKDIHCQKPLAHNIAEGRAICSAVKRYNIVWLTGSQQRSQAKFRRACELVRNGRIGKLHTVEVGLPTRWQQTCPPQPVQPVPPGFDYDLWLGPAPQAPYTEKRCMPLGWRWIYDYASGLITDWGAHHLDIAQWGMGTELTGPVEIQARDALFGREGIWNTAYRYRVTCKYAEGYTLVVADTDKLRQGIRFIGTEGWVHVRRGHNLDAHPKSILDSRIGPNEIRLYESNDHKGNFLDCIRTRAETAAPAEIGHRSVAIGHLGTIAMKVGCKLRWDPQKERFLNNNAANSLLTRSMRSPWRL
ncbi:MAG: Gfo/Idh/MocA family protein [Planctomycetota bacterium]|jgi:predicted dehydrogenase